MSEIKENKQKSFREVYESLTQEDWMEIIRKATEMQLETLKEAEEIKSTQNNASNADE
jgi:predicted Holliday junction resolvase-like endonuclease